MLRHLQLGIALAVLAGLLVTPASVAADPSPVFVNPFFVYDPPNDDLCFVRDVDGNFLLEVPADAPVIIRWGWGADNRGLVRAFLNAVDFSISVDGVPVDDTNQYFGPIVSFPDFDGDGDDEFITRWIYDAGILEVGTHSFVSDLSLRHRLPDLLVFENGRPFLFGPGTIFTGACDILVVA